MNKFAHGSFAIEICLSTPMLFDTSKSTKHLVNQGT
jgi:hypothetical protein